jgi:hypothetical protein
VITLSHSGGYVIYYEARGAASGYIPDFNVNIAPASASAAAQSQRMLAEPPRDGGHRPFAGWARGLLPERVGDDGAGGCRGCIPTGRIDGAHADDDDVSCVRADDARGPAPAAWPAAAAKVTGSGNWPLSRATGPAKMLFITTACFETL